MAVPHVGRGPVDRPESMDERASPDLGRHVRPRSGDERLSPDLGCYVRPESGDASASPDSGRWARCRARGTAHSARPRTLRLLPASIVARARRAAAAARRPRRRTTRSHSWRRLGNSRIQERRVFGFDIPQILTPRTCGIRPTTRDHYRIVEVPQDLTPRTCGMRPTTRDHYRIVEVPQDLTPSAPAPRARRAAASGGWSGRAGARPTGGRCRFARPTARLCRVPGADLPRVRAGAPRALEAGRRSARNYPASSPGRRASSRRTPSCGRCPAR